MERAPSTARPSALVVDDNPVILLNAVDIFEDANFSVFAALNFDEALAQLELHADEIVLAFIDIQLTGSNNGLQLARLIAETYPWVALLVTSGVVVPKAGEMPEGAIFISMPYAPENILDFARQALTTKGVDLA